MARIRLMCALIIDSDRNDKYLVNIDKNMQTTLGEIQFLL